MPKPLALPVKKTDVLSEESEQPTTPAEVETPAETPNTDPTPTPAAPAEENPTPDAGENTEPVTPEAPAQEVAAESSSEGDAAKSTPAPASRDTSQVAKAAILGSYAEADVVWDAINTLSYNLKWFLWDVVIDDDKSKEEKTSLIEAALGEFSQIIVNVTDALITDGVGEETVKAVESTREQTPEALVKSAKDATAQGEELTKSVDAKSTELAEVTKTLTEVTQQLEETRTPLKAESDAKQKAETELATIKARKTLAFNEGARKAVIVDDTTATQPSTSMPSKRIQGVY